MQEWLNWTVSKTVVAQVTVGSNPTLSVFFSLSLNNRTQKDFTVAKCLIFAACGAVAQLGECIPRTDEVTGSNPVCSILNGFQLSVVSYWLKREFVELNSRLTENYKTERCRSWLNWHDWKSCVLFCSTVGSNPTLSASFLIINALAMLGGEVAVPCICNPLKQN